MADPAIGSDVHQPLDVHRHFGAQGALDAEIPLDGLAQLVDVGIVEITNALRGIDSGLLEDVLCSLPADAEDVGQADLDLLVAG